MIDTKHTRSSPAFAILLIMITGTMLAGMDATAKYLAGGLPVLMVIWGRYFFHTVITFAVYSGGTRSLSFLRAHRPGMQLVRAGALFGATTTFYFSLSLMQLADASSIQFLAPVLVTALSGLFLGEHVGPRRWAAVTCGFVGARPGSGVLGWAALLPLATAVLLAIYMMMTRIIRTKDDPAATTFYSTALGALILSMIVPFQWQAMNNEQWFLMAVMGCAGAGGHFLLVKAFHSAEASILAPFTYAQVIAAIVWGYVVFADVPSPWTLSGASVVICSGLFVWYRETRVVEHNKKARA